MSTGQDLPDERQQYHLGILEALPFAIYTTDATGKITFYNQAAADFAGRRPVLGNDEWCVTWRMYQRDGTPLPHNQCPMAVALKDRRPVRGEEAVAERPDGTRIPFRAYPTPLYDSAGTLVGAVNLLMDISSQKHSQAEGQRMKALPRERAGFSPQEINRIRDDASAKITGKHVSRSNTEAIATGQSDPLTILLELLRRTIASDADPYLLVGSLVEGIASAIALKISREEHGEIAVETVRLLRDRMRSHGLI